MSIIDIDRHIGTPIIYSVSLCAHWMQHNNITSAGAIEIFDAISRNEGIRTLQMDVRERGDRRYCRLAAITIDLMLCGGVGVTSAVR